MTLSLFFTRFFLALKGRFDDVRGERGATAVEYALIIAAIAVVVGAAAVLLGNRVSGKFDAILK